MKFTSDCLRWHGVFLWFAFLPLIGCSPTGNPSARAKSESTSPPSDQPVPVATPMRMTDEAFRFAAYEGRLEAVREGLEAGNNVNAAEPQRQLTPLHMAAFNGHTEVIKLLLAHGATLDARDAEGKTPLLHACTGPFVDAVEVLIAAGADVDAREQTEAFTPLMMAAGLGQPAVVQVLLAHHANPDLLDDDGDSALAHAQNQGHTEIVQLLQK